MSSRANLRLATPGPEHIEELSSWFANQEELYRWAGPGIEYPITRAGFAQQLGLHELASYSLLTRQNQLAGFGQFYNRQDRCHLGRLAISPHFRGQGMVLDLVELLSAKGKQRLGLESCSLFVLCDNTAAISAYLRAGFQQSEYPEEIELPDCIYMVREYGRLGTLSKQIK